MKRKELFKRLTAVSMSAMMAVTMVPSTAFASEDGFFAEEPEVTAEVTEPAETTDSGEADFGGEVEAEETDGFESGDGFFGEEEETDSLDDFQSDGEVTEGTEEENEAAADAIVHVTISTEGVLANAKDESLMALKDVTVKDLNNDGILTYDEALKAAHDVYFEGGAEAGFATTEDGKYISKLWGTEGNAFGFWQNDISSTALTDEVKADDYLTAFIYKDKEGYSDSYTKFDQKEYEATTEKAFPVSVKKAGYDAKYNVVFSDCENAVLQAYDSTFKALAAEDYTIDGYNVTFHKAGTYYLVTGGTDDLNLVPAVAKVTVTDEGTQKKSYLSYLGLRNLGTGTNDFVNLLQNGVNEISYTVPAKDTGLYIHTELSEDAPEGTTVTAKYYDYFSNAEFNGEIRSSTKKCFIGAVQDDSIKPEVVVVSVGVENDIQTYTIKLNRSFPVTIADANGNQASFLDDVYYLPEDNCDLVKATVDVKNVKITVNGIETERNKTCDVPVVFDEETNEFELKVIASTDEDSVTQTYKIRKLTSETSFNGTCGENATWSLKGGTLTISGNGLLPDFNIVSWNPSQSVLPTWNPLAKLIKNVVIEEGITSVGKVTFKGSSIESISLPETLTSIGEEAFQGCMALKAVRIPDAVSSIGDYAFYRCEALESVSTATLGNSIFNACANLKKVELRKGLVVIPNYAFLNCTGIEEVTIPEGVTTIYNSAFSGCSGIKSLTLPESWTPLSAGPFASCQQLSDLHINGDNYVIDNNVVYTKDGKTLVWCLATNEGKFVVKNGITALNAYAFYNCDNLMEIVLPDSLESIGANAFNSCDGLQKLEIPDSVTTIGAGAIAYCDILEDVKLPSGLTAIPDALFRGCPKMTSVTIPETVTSVGSYAFSQCTALKSVKLPKNVTSVGAYMFNKCTALTEVVIPDGVEVLPEKIFADCTALETVILPASITAFDSNPFYDLNKTLKYVLYGGTKEQWDNISGSSYSKPVPPSFSAIVLYGCTSIGDNANNAPKIAEQPLDQVVKAGQAMENMTIRVTPEENATYYFTWYKKLVFNLNVVTSTASEDGYGSSCMPDAATQTNALYYCRVEKVDASGAATWIDSENAIVALAMDEFNGCGTERNPYELATADDLLTLQKLVNVDGNNMQDVVFKMTADITLPADWSPIGCTKDGSNNINSGRNMNPFRGTFDGGNNTITVPEGGKPLFGYVQEAQIRNLNIYGTKIDGYGLVNNLEGVGLRGSAVVIDNVTLKSGSSTLKSGLIGANITTNSFAGCSAGYTATVRNCTIEKDVVIGYNRDQKIVGSIAGRMQGYVENCVSYATVYGTDYVGGIIGTRDNAMGDCKVNNCSFYGSVEASGNCAGGIVGGGYTDSSAPNGIRATINNCTSAGNIKGADCVGGIMGGDPIVAQAWNPYTIKGNSFTGKVEATNGTYVGGIIGFYDSLNKYDDIANNYYDKNCGAKKGIGFVKIVDTNCETHEDTSGAIYINTAKSVEDCPSVPGCSWKPNMNRTDDPLGADADKLANTDGVKLYAEKLIISGDYATTFYLGEELDLSGMKIKAQMSDATTREVALSELSIEGYDNTKRGEQSVILSYEGAKEIIIVKVLKKDAENIKVTFSLLGDKLHNSDEDKEYHTLNANNLETWIGAKEYEVGGNATVLDVVSKVLTENEYSFKNDRGDYISAITPKNGAELAEKINGTNSGWMYTLNGIHSDLTVREQYLEDGDIIVFHYTDDYTQEHDHIWGIEWSSDENAHWHECTYAYNKCDITDNTKKDGYAVHIFGEGKVTKEATCKEEGVKTYTCSICGYEKTEVLPKTDAHIFDEGKVTKKATYKEAGEKVYTCKICGATKTEIIPVIVHDHDFTWKMISEATVFEAEKQEGTCTICGEKETREVGTALKAVAKLNVKSIPLQKKQTTKKVKVTMAKGDSVVSWKSSNKKIAKVDKNGVIKAGTKVGTAKITVTLKSGKTATVTVKVQNAKVATRKLKGLKSSVTVKKGKKLALKPVISPITSQEKVTYTSSNKKVATVSSKGVITGKKKGTVKITVKSGKKNFTVKVKVK